MQYSPPSAVNKASYHELLDQSELNSTLEIIKEGFSHVRKLSKGVTDIIYIFKKLYFKSKSITYLGISVRSPTNARRLCISYNISHCFRSRSIPHYIVSGISLCSCCHMRPIFHSLVPLAFDI